MTQVAPYDMRRDFQAFDLWQSKACTSAGYEKNCTHLELVPGTHVEKKDAGCRPGGHAGMMHEADKAFECVIISKRGAQAGLAC